MSQCARVFDVLKDGRWHEINEIHDRAGTMRLNSRVADLRRQGHVVEHEQRGQDHFYRLVLLGASAAFPPADAPSGPTHIPSGRPACSPSTGAGAASEGPLDSPSQLVLPVPVTSREREAA